MGKLYHPDNWAVIKVTIETTCYYRVLANFSGAQLDNTGYRFSTPIKSVKSGIIGNKKTNKLDMNYVEFETMSTNRYRCWTNIQIYGVQNHTYNPWMHFKSQEKNKNYVAEIMDKNTDWLNLDYTRIKNL